MTYTTAPAASRISTSAELLVGTGLSRKETNPNVDGIPATLNESFKLIGRPCRGPIVLSVVARCSSNCFARAKASSKNVSVRQLVNCWAIAARLLNAVVTSAEVYSFLEILARRAVASPVLVISSSRGVRRLLFAGMSRQFRFGLLVRRVWIEGGRRHSGGILERAVVCFLWAFLARFEWSLCWFEGDCFRDSGVRIGARG